MDIYNLASALFGTSRAEETNGVSNTVDSVSAIGATDSDSGNVGLTMDADITPADDAEGDETIFDVPTSPAVAAGDDVVMGLTGNGPLKVPIVLANPGSGDRQQAQINNAVELAEQAEAVAQATGQYFWSDTDGAHVTQVTKDDWNDSTSPNYHSGPNSLWNSLGMLFRDGLTNLMAVLTNGIAIYDGLGNAASNIIAEFTANLVRIGGRLLGTGTSTASVQFFQSDASQTDVTAIHTVGTTDPPTGPDDVYGVNHGVQVTTSTDDSELGEGAEGHAAWAALDLFADVNPDYEAGSAMLKATTGGTPYDSSTDPTLGVLRQVADNGTEASRIYGSAAEIQLNDTARYKTGVVTVEQAIAALTTPLYSNSSSVSITRANTDTTGPSVTVPAGTYILVVAYTFPTASGSGTRSVAIGAKTGGSTLYNTSVEGSHAAVRKSMFEVMHLSAQTTVTAYVAASVTSGSSNLYIGMTRLS